jgi:hypothetical protein
MAVFVETVGTIVGKKKMEPIVRQQQNPTVGLKWNIDVAAARRKMTSWAERTAQTPSECGALHNKRSY